MYGATYINISGKAPMNQARYQRAYNSLARARLALFRDQRINNYGRLLGRAGVAPSVTALLCSRDYAIIP
jgi:hypothetical protein